MEMRMSNELRKLLLSTDDGGQIDPSDLWTRQSDEAISGGLAKEIGYAGSCKWIVLTEKGWTAKSQIQAG